MHVAEETETYGVASISRLLKIVGLFCRRALSKRLYFAKETYNFKEPTNRSHPIVRKRQRARKAVYIYVYTYIYTYVYIYVYVAEEREK